MITPIEQAAIRLNLHRAVQDKRESPYWIKADRRMSDYRLRADLEMLAYAFLDHVFPLTKEPSNEN